MKFNEQEILATIFDVDLHKDPACVACERELSYYIDNELAGENVAALFPEVHAHLQTCASCAELHQDMLMLIEMERTGTLLEPEGTPEIDLSFLKKTTAKQKLWRKVEIAGQEIMQLASQIPIILQEAQARFGQLALPLPPPRMATVPTTRAEGDQQVHQLLDISSEESDLAFQLELGYASEDGVTVGVSLHDRNTQDSLRGVRTTLRDERKRIVASELSDNEGHVTFVELPAGKYIIEVKYQGVIRQLPISIES